MDFSDVFVILDNVQFEKGYFQNRCKIRDGKGGFQFLSLPLENSSHDLFINQKLIDRENRLIKKNLKTIALLYSKSHFFSEYFFDICKIFEDSSMQVLASLNVAIITYIIQKLGIDTKIVFASDVVRNEGQGGGKLVFDICKELGATSYLSGKFGKEYLDETLFQKNAIHLIYQDYECTSYNQSGEDEFLPYLSILDLLFNMGKSSLQTIRTGRKYD